MGFILVEKVILWRYKLSTELSALNIILSHKLAWKHSIWKYISNCKCFQQKTKLNFPPSTIYRNTHETCGLISFVDTTRVHIYDWHSRKGTETIQTNSCVLLVFSLNAFVLFALLWRKRVVSSSYLHSTVLCFLLY